MQISQHQQKKYINQAVKEKLERDVQGAKIEISMEEWFDYKIAKE